MNDDFLSQLSSALAEEKQGATAVPSVTRDRVMASLAHTAPKRKLRLAWGFPLLLGLVGSSAWASQHGGQMLAWLEEKVGTSEAAPARVIASAPESPSAAASSAGEPIAVTPSPAMQGSVTQGTVAPGTVAPSAPTPSVVTPTAPASAIVASTAAKPVERAAATPGAAASLVDGPSTTVPTGPSVSSDPPAAAPSGSASEGDDGGLALYRAAHDAQFRSANYATALDGYQAYLRLHGAGAFVPEARYNSALCLLNLGRQGEARELLQLFADGTYGDYRRQRARELLEAIEPR